MLLSGAIVAMSPILLWIDLSAGMPADWTARPAARHGDAVARAWVPRAPGRLWPLRRADAPAPAAHVGQRSRPGRARSRRTAPAKCSTVCTSR
jgi:hypothetical protein